MNKKVFVLLPDGIGLRNFAYTDFNKIGESKGYDITYWNNTPFSIEKETGFKELKIEDQTLHPLTTIYTRVRKRIELNVFDKKYNETVYNTYNFKQSTKGLKNLFKKLYVDVLVFFNSSVEKSADNCVLPFLI